MDFSLNVADAAKDIGVVATVAGLTAAEFLPRLVAAAAVLITGAIAAGWLGRSVGRVLARSGRLEPTAIPVIGTAARYGLLILVGIAALSQLGVQTTAVLTVLGAAGLAIGLALQGTLQNIAAGIMLLWLQPFRVGDYVETATVAGSVREVGLFATRMTSGDGLYRFVPNSELWSRILTNQSRNPTRLVSIGFAVPYDHDIAGARRVLKEHAEAHPKVASAPPVEVVPVTLGETSVTLELRAWTSTADYWQTRWDLTEGALAALISSGMKAPVARIIRVTGEDVPARAA